MKKTKTPQNYYSLYSNIERKAKLRNTVIEYKPSEAFYEKMSSCWTIHGQELDQPLTSWKPANVQYKQHRKHIPAAQLFRLVSEEVVAALRPHLEGQVQFLPVIVSHTKKKHAPILAWHLRPVITIDCIDWSKSAWEPLIDRRGRKWPNINGTEFDDLTLQLDRIPPNVHLFAVKDANSKLLCSDWLVRQIRRFDTNLIQFSKHRLISRRSSKRAGPMKFKPLFQPPTPELPVHKPSPSRPEPPPPHESLRGIEFYKCGKPIARSDLRALEKQIGVGVPVQIADFLTRVGGLEIEATEIFRGSGRDANPCKAILRMLKDARSLWKHTWDDKVLPIAEDGSGGYFTIHRGDGSIVHFDHELIDLTKKRPKAHRVANTFKAWLNRLAKGEGY